MGKAWVWFPVAQNSSNDPPCNLVNLQITDNDQIRSNNLWTLNFALPLPALLEVFPWSERKQLPFFGLVSHSLYSWNKYQKREQRRTPQLQAFRKPHSCLAFGSAKAMIFAEVVFISNKFRSPEVSMALCFLLTREKNCKEWKDMQQMHGMSMWTKEKENKAAKRRDTSEITWEEKIWEVGWKKCNGAIEGQRWTVVHTQWIRKDPSSENPATPVSAWSH